MLNSGDNSGGYGVSKPTCPEICGSVWYFDPSATVPSKPLAHPARISPTANPSHPPPSFPFFPNFFPSSHSHPHGLRPWGTAPTGPMPPGATSRTPGRSSASRASMAAWRPVPSSRPSRRRRRSAAWAAEWCRHRPSPRGAGGRATCLGSCLGDESVLWILNTS